MQPTNTHWQASESLNERFFLIFSIAAAFLVALATLGAAGRNVATTAEIKTRTSELENELHARRKAEVALKNTQLLLEYAMDLAVIGHWEFDVQSNCFTFNDHFYALYGTTAKREGGYVMPAEIYYREFCHPDDLDIIAEEIGKQQASSSSGENSLHMEHRIVRRDGEVRHIVVRCGFIRDAAGQIIKSQGANQDITEIKQIEEALRDNIQLF